MNRRFFINKKGLTPQRSGCRAATEIRLPKGRRWWGWGWWWGIRVWICRVKPSETASGANVGSHRNCNLITAL